ncbi:TPA: AAA family ATPase [Legionella pneumophila]|nr:AAA family ATPase [Legionella pneumophila]HAT6933092.1 AAA family ATPase [Legionella pneumophila]HAT7744805.1 AAA family ATPase [Legionella pneumophila]HAT7820632.1 AAA family ATPase [Legionella pneumophila]HAT7931017.1 AAA family ATPase [Legionella pneumophila]
MLSKFKKIDNFGIYNAFDWETELQDESGRAGAFQHINIIYGRNYSGKTTLSRIMRALETGEISDKFEHPSFSLELADKSLVTQATLTSHNKKIRVFNEDFVRENLRFITNPDDNIEPFAILGDDNNKIEKEIERLQVELGSKEEGKETGIYAQKAEAHLNYTNAFISHKKANDDLEDELKEKATNKKVGIKYKPERFGDQNYSILTLKKDIEKVLSTPPPSHTNEELEQYERLILEKTLPSIPALHMPKFNFQNLMTKAEAFVTQKISISDKIEGLVKDAIVNRWVNEGRILHKDTRIKCAFCDNTISEDRWKELEKHFDEESDQLEKNINELISCIKEEKNAVISALSIEKSYFYSKFHDPLDKLSQTLKDVVEKYEESSKILIEQLESRKKDILNQKSFNRPADLSDDLLNFSRAYEVIRKDSNNFTTSLSNEQKIAKDALRLKEVSDYLITIRYQERLKSIEELKSKLDGCEHEKERIDLQVTETESLIASKKRELRDEEKGAKKVNEYLNNFFGHQFLTLEAKKEDNNEDELKRIRFEIIRDGKKAYHLSEGECSLLAFCYFLAKLDDTDTRDSRPIIWIDDPISSLDGNHIFFVYSLLKAEIVSTGKFEQLFVSTHNLDFLKYLKKLNGTFLGDDRKFKDYQKAYFVVVRKDKRSTIKLMPKYLREYVTEFNYLFHQILKCSTIDSIDDTNYTIFFNFANNARKFFEIYLYYKYPDQGMTEDTLDLFFGKDKIPAVLTDRINNEYSHLSGVFERGAIPVEVPEMQTAAKQIITRLKEDMDQFNALLKSVGEPVVAEPIHIDKE